MNLSFIIPAYNAEKTILRCLSSILKIDREDYEIIVVDDGSTDKTHEILSSIQDKRVSVISQKNQGVSSARNLGITQSCGKYIAFVDADDEIIYEEYKNIFSEFINEIDVIYFGFERVGFQQTSKVVPCLKPGNYLDKNYFYIIAKNMFDFPFAKRQKSKYISGYVFQFILNRDFVIENKLIFPLGIHLAEDMFFCQMFLTKCKSLLVKEYIMYKYITTIGSAIQRFRRDYWREVKNLHHQLTMLPNIDMVNVNKFYVAQAICSINYYSKNFPFFEIDKLLCQLRNILDDADFRKTFKDLEFKNWTLIENVRNYCIQKKLYIFLLILQKLNISWTRLKRFLKLKRGGLV